MRLLDFRLDLDLRCNFRCAYCPTQRNGSFEKPFIDLDLVEKVFPVLNRFCWNVYLSCSGEPTLHPRFSEILRRIPSLLPDADTCIITNGWNLTPDVIPLLISSGISRVFCSIDTIDPEKYREITGSRPGGINRVMHNIEEAIHMRGDRKYPNFTISSVVAKRTLDGLEDVAQWAMAAGADCLKLLPLTPCEGTEMGPDQVVDYIPLVVKKFRQIGDIVTRKGKVVDYPYMHTSLKIRSTLGTIRLFRNRKEYLVSAAGRFISSRRDDKCRFLGYVLRMHPDGKLYLCPAEEFQVADLSLTPQVDIRKAVMAKVAQTRSTRRKMCPECDFYSHSK